MTPELLLTLSILAFVALGLFVARRVFRDAQVSRPFDAGAVSTRWLAELRRDEPWTRS